MCHPSGEFTKRIEEVYREGFWPSSASFTKAEGREGIKAEGIGLVGNGYLMIDAGNDSGLCRGTLKGKEGKAIFTENGSQVGVNPLGFTLSSFSYFRLVS